jgi:ribosome assembly protein 4
MIFESETGKQVGFNLNAHKKWVTSLAWEPLHKNKDSDLIASASKDGSVIFY